MRALDPNNGLAAVLAAIGDTPGKPQRFFGRFEGGLVLVQAWDAGGGPPKATDLLKGNRSLPFPTHPRPLTVPGGSGYHPASISKKTRNR